MLYRTRKTKEVDFGFSLGLGPLAPGSLGPSQHASHPTGIVAEPPPPSNSAPANTQSPLPYDSELSVLSGQKPAQRTPGSARNRGQKRSIFDIPLEEPPEERRSTKRRKIGRHIGCTSLTLLNLLRFAEQRLRNIRWTRRRDNPTRTSRFRP